MGIQARLYLWPYYNNGLGRSAVRIQETSDPFRSHYVGWPFPRTEAEATDIVNCIAFDLPEKQDVTFDDFLKTFPYYIDPELQAFGEILSNYYIAQTGTYNLVAAKKEYQQKISSFQSSFEALSDQWDQHMDNAKKTSGTCAHAVMHALRSAKYINEDAYNYLWKTPYFRARKGAESVVSDFLTKIIPMIAESATKDISAEMQNLPIHTATQIDLSVTNAQHQFLNQQVHLLHLIKLLKKVDRKHGNQLEKQLEHDTNNAINFASINILTSITKFCNDISSTRYNKGREIFNKFKDYLEGRSSIKDAKEKCMEIINLNRGYKSYSWDTKLKVYNALITIFTLGIFNVVNKIKNDKWMLFRYHCPRRTLDKIERQLDGLEKLEASKLKV